MFLNKYNISAILKQCRQSADYSEEMEKKLTEFKTLYNDFMNKVIHILYQYKNALDFLSLKSSDDFETI